MQHHRARRGAPAGLGAASAPRLGRGRAASLLAHQAAELGERDEVAVLERAREPGRGGGADLLEQADRRGGQGASAGAVLRHASTDGGRAGGLTVVFLVGTAQFLHSLAMPSEHVDQLRFEYEQISQQFRHQERTLWGGASVILVAAIGAFVAMPRDVQPLGVFLHGFMSTMGAFWWLCMMRRGNRFNEARRERLEIIEAELQMAHHRAVERLRGDVGFEWMAIVAFTILAMFWIALFALSCAGVSLGAPSQGVEPPSTAHPDAGI
ncbi:MAG: hypothetical protein SangKO_076100 [Sandaracinaceae bacterium]